jgi:hypothetical protein
MLDFSVELNRWGIFVAWNTTVERFALHVLCFHLTVWQDDWRTP